MTRYETTLEAQLRANCCFTNPNYSFPPYNFSNTVLNQNATTQTQAYKGFFLFTVTKQQQNHQKREELSRPLGQPVSQHVSNVSAVLTVDQIKQRMPLLRGKVPFG